ncbi:MAG: hypothetical protein WC506_04905 [Candidatus Micrarchaeia archaeon]
MENNRKNRHDEKAQGNAQDANSRHFAQECRLMFGMEGASLQKCAKWLLEFKEPKLAAKSYKSGKDIFLPCTDYPEKARFESMAEAVGENAKITLSINDVKDIDSLVRAAGESFAYTGNMVFGNSTDVSESADVSESHCVTSSTRVDKSRAVGYSTIVKESSFIYGCNVISLSEHCMRCHQVASLNRCFEGSFNIDSSDCYYTYYCNGCTDCIFCFNQRNARHCIGNLKLPADKYAGIKKSLVSQMRDTIESRHELPSLPEILNQSPPPKLAKGFLQAGKPPANTQAYSAGGNVERAFEQTSRLLLGTQLQLGRTGNWLSKHNIRIRQVKSAASCEPMPAPSYQNFLAFDGKRYVSAREAQEAAKLAISPQAAMSMTLGNAPSVIGGIAFICPEFHEGNAKNAHNCPITLNAADCESVHGCVYMKKSAYSTWSRNSECIFGCAFTFDTSFCINCYNSFGLSRCFEVDCGRGCTGCYYCHNVENVHDSMFCFNAKNLRYAIGNVEVGKERFLGAKKILLAWLGARLESGNGMELGIFNLAAKP